jgi:hypothetical protein
MTVLILEESKRDRRGERKKGILGRAQDHEPQLLKPKKTKKFADRIQTHIPRTFVFCESPELGHNRA